MNRQTVWQLLVFLVVAAIAMVLFVQFRDTLTLERLARYQGRVEKFAEEQPLLTFGLAFALYVLVTGLSLPGAAIMSLIYGWLFGFSRGLVVVNFAATAGATVAFLLSRYLLRDLVQRRFGPQLATFNNAFEKDGAFYLFALRLTPAVPFFIVNLVMALTPIRTRTFWWVTQLGMLPAGAVFVYAGSSVPNLETLAQEGVGSIFTPQLAAAFMLLGFAPLILRKLLQWIWPGAGNKSDIDVRA